MAGSEPYKGVEERLRLTYRLAKMISDHEGPRVVQAWVTGLNPELNDRVPLRLLLEENLEKVGPELLGAARIPGRRIAILLKVPGLIHRLGRKPDRWSVPDWASQDRTGRSVIALTIPKECIVFCMHLRKGLVAFSKH